MKEPKRPNRNKEQVIIWLYPLQFRFLKSKGNQSAYVRMLLNNAMADKKYYSDKMEEQPQPNKPKDNKEWRDEDDVLKQSGKPRLMYGWVKKGLQTFELLGYIESRYNEGRLKKEYRITPKGVAEGISWAD